VMNQPPSGGSLQVSPQSGTALSDQFLFQALTWTDAPEDYPLGFLFGYYVNNINDQIIVHPRGEITYASVLLGQGRVGNNQVYCFVNVSDTWGAVATQPYTGGNIKVFPISGLSAISSVASQQLDKAFTFNDATKISQVLTGVVGALTAVDCSLGGLICQNINRFGCSATPHTCGACLPGFVGLAGDSNAPCQVVPGLSSGRSAAARLVSWHSLAQLARLPSSHFPSGVNGSFQTTLFLSEDMEREEEARSLIKSLEMQGDGREDAKPPNSTTLVWQQKLQQWSRRHAGVHGHAPSYRRHVHTRQLDESVRIRNVYERRMCACA